jgi:hypothetical protein
MQWLGLREKTDSVDCCKIVVSLDFLFTFLSRKLRSNQRGKKTIINNELKVKAVWVPTQKESDFYAKRIENGTYSLLSKSQHFYNITLNIMSLAYQ